jgi:hypothetical protein
VRIGSLVTVLVLAGLVLWMTSFAPRSLLVIRQQACRRQAVAEGVADRWAARRAGALVARAPAVCAPATRASN